MCAAGNSGDDPGHCIPSSVLATFMYLAVLPPKAVGGIHALFYLQTTSWFLAKPICGVYLWALETTIDSSLKLIPC